MSSDDSKPTVQGDEEVPSAQPSSQTSVQNCSQEGRGRAHGQDVVSYTRRIITLIGTPTRRSGGGVGDSGSAMTTNTHSNSPWDFIEPGNRRGSRRRHFSSIDWARIRSIYMSRGGEFRPHQDRKYQGTRRCILTMPQETDSA